ncbi:hypothetical protein [Paenibacillus prosopidis]|uniref:Uncharacterized protein n=1 Tax=Paenibacillus prosopidis TaxID=630520 RepID=A0A368VKJ6_9BACL|nr:hypothetical protein [Paenibacillus prosopidis]RCW42221.1 hypothetical protein DFP97_11850 [Paenibacillus prosopidis]
MDLPNNKKGCLKGLRTLETAPWLLYFGGETKRIHELAYKDIKFVICPFLPSFKVFTDIESVICCKTVIFGVF